MNENTISKVCFLGIIIYPLLFIWQGLDLTDMGYALCGFQNFFAHPAGVELLFVNWGTFFIGWLLSFVSCDLGIVFYRMIVVLSYWTVLYIVYSLVKEQIENSKQWLLAPVLLVTLIYATFTGVDWLGYDVLTAFFYVLSVYFLYKGCIGVAGKQKTAQGEALRNIQKTQSKFDNTPSYISLFLAGLLLMYNVFVRFPNVLGLSLFFSVFIYGYFRKEKAHKICLYFFILCLGALSMLLIVLTLMKLFGHHEIYITRLTGILSVATSSSSSGSSHSGQGLIQLFINDHWQVLIWAICFSLLILVLAKLIYKWPVYIQAIIVLMVALLLYPLMWKMITAFTGVLYIILAVGTIINRKRKPQLALLNFLSFCILLFAPLGSNNGISKAVFGSWLALPVAIFSTLQIIDSQSNDEFFASRHFPKKMLKSGVFILLGLVCVISSYGKMLCPYRDSNRWHLFTPIDNSHLSRGVLTSSNRSRAVSECLTALGKYAPPSSIALGYNEISTIHYLSKTVPYLGNPWPLLISPPKLSGLLMDKSATSMPDVIFRATVNTSDRFWPRPIETNDKYHLPPNKSRAILDDFCQANNFEVVWKNSCFEILMAKDTLDNFDNTD